MKRTVISYGLIAGLIVSLIMSISMIATKDSHNSMGISSMLIGYLSMIIAFSMIYVAVKSYRDKNQQGLISFGKAFRIGLLISLIASTMYVLTWAVVYHYFVPDYLDRYMDQMLAEARATATADQLKKMADEAAQQKEMYKQPVFFTLFTYMEILPIGLLVSLITALILKRKTLKQNRDMAHQLG